MGKKIKIFQFSFVLYRNVGDQFVLLFCTPLKSLKVHIKQGFIKVSTKCVSALLHLVPFEYVTWVTFTIKSFHNKLKNVFPPPLF